MLNDRKKDVKKGGVTQCMENVEKIWLLMCNSFGP